MATFIPQFEVFLQFLWMGGQPAAIVPALKDPPGARADRHGHRINKAKTCSLGNPAAPALNAWSEDAVYSSR